MTQPTCPKCGGHEFELTITQVARVVFLEDGDHDVTEQPFGDIEWGDDTHSHCHDCGHSAKLWQMKTKGT